MCRETLLIRECVRTGQSTTARVHNVEEISADEVRSVYPSFKRFVRMQKIPLDYLEAITPLLKRKQKLFVASKH